MPDPSSKADSYVHRSSIAAAIFNEFDQKSTDAVVEAVFKAALNERVRLARMACDETGLGVWQHKVIKNVVASQLVYESIRYEQTAGVISCDDASGVTEIVQPLGPVLGVIPVTNPTSTVIFKCLIALKSRNPIIISPHGRAIGCSGEAARVCYEAALEAGAPDDCIQWLDECSKELTHSIMGHPKLALLLATGGPGLVKAAYSSGTPAIGVGSGNVPVVIEKSADIPFAVSNIIASKTFDNGTVCASEQAIVVERGSAAAVKEAFEAAHCCFLNGDEIEKLEAIVQNPDTGLMNPKIVGQPVGVIAGMAGIDVPAGTKIMIAPQERIGEEYPLSGEILAPILAFYVGDDFEDALKIAVDLNYRGGIGHTASIYSNDDERIRLFSELMNAGRIVVNTPSSQGGVGGIYNTLKTSFTLGCGAGGKNITTENISTQHLVNIKRLCRRRDNNKWARVNPETYLDESVDVATVIAEYHKNS